MELLVIKLVPAAGHEPAGSPESTERAGVASGYADKRAHRYVSVLPCAVGGFEATKPHIAGEAGEQEHAAVVQHPCEFWQSIDFYHVGYIIYY